MYGSIDSSARLRQGAKLVVQIVLLLEDPIHTLGKGVLRAMVLFGHTYWHTSGLQLLDVLMRTVLASAIRVMNGMHSRRQSGQSHLQRFERILSF